MTKSAAQRGLVALQTTTDPATLKDMIAWLALNLKADGESVDQFLKGCLTSRAALHYGEPSADLAPIDDASDLLGCDPDASIFEEMESALITDERFRNHFFKGAWRAFITSDVADAPPEANGLWDGERVGKLFVEAALDGRLALFDECRMAMIRPADHTDAGKPLS
tara:strand:- start:193 stop:690 length:498 start_codon:yes stop_codon:yes gene_type:complete